jgi:hypothetical protein
MTSSHAKSSELGISCNVNERAISMDKYRIIKLMSWNNLEFDAVIFGLLMKPVEKSEYSE